jgi:hypothetical protein
MFWRVQIMTALVYDGVRWACRRCGQSSIEFQDLAPCYRSQCGGIEAGAATDEDIAGDVGLVNIRPWQAKEARPILP